jgi:hypothetical protein
MPSALQVLNARKTKTRNFASRFLISSPASIFQVVNSNTLFSFQHKPAHLHAKMDRQSVFSLSVLPPEYDNEDTRGQIQAQLEQFILQFRLDNAFIYRSDPACKLLAMVNILPGIKSVRTSSSSNTIVMLMLATLSRSTKSWPTDWSRSLQKSFPL